MGKTSDLKKSGDMKGKFHTRMGTIKDRNGKDLKEEIKKRWQEYIEELYKGLNKPYNHDGVVTHLESDILERIRKHYYKVSGGDGIPAGLFKILKDEAVKVLHSVCQQIWKT